jgi:outer membrane protein assembly factor BamB
MPGFALPSVIALLVCLIMTPTSSRAQVIDFETLPAGGSTVDQQEISTEYAPLGVTFSLLDPLTGTPIGFPRIAKVGLPQTAFEGCVAADTPKPNLGLGTSFLTDGNSLGVDGDLRIEYATPVAQASGVILDIDCRVNGGPPCEQWTITAHDDTGAVLQIVVIDPPQGENPGCQSPQAGPGDSEAFGWVIDVGSPLVKSIVLRHTGAATNVGLGFDNFSVSGLPGLPVVAVASSADTICAGETITLQADVTGGVPPFTYQWQQEISPSNWADLGNAPSEQIQPSASTRYRVTVTDASLQETTSSPAEVFVTSGEPLCATSLLVSSNSNSRVVRYSFQSRLPEVLVSTGLGGLNGASKLVCGGDGNLYVASQNNDQVLRYNVATGAFVDIFVTAGSGGLDVPVGLDFGPDGNLYVASASGNSVLRYDGGTGAYIDTFVPNGSGLNIPTGILFGPDDNLYVCSHSSDKVLRFDGTTGATMGDFVAAGSGGLDSPRGLTFGPDGNLYVAEEINDSVRRYNGKTGAFIDIFVAGGSGGLDRANDVAFGPDGLLYVASFNNNKLLCFDGANGAFLYELPDSPLIGPAWLAVGCETSTTDVPVGPRPRAGLSIEPNVPNPFALQTTIGFTLPVAGHAQATVVNIAGRIVASLLDRDLPAGRHSVQWNGRDNDGRVVPAGVYFLRVRSGGAARGLTMLRMQ